MATTELYLAIGTRFVVQQRKAEWHTSKKDVILPSGEAAKRTCPLTGQTVNWVKMNGFDIFYPDRVVRVRLKLEKGDLDDAKVANFKPVHFGYYIPDTAKDPSDPTGKRKFQNPSGFLRRFAIRTDDGGSSWLMNQGDIPYMLMAEMQDAGAVPFVARLHPDDAKEHIIQGIMALQRQIIAAECSAQQSQIDADAQLATATEKTGKNPEQAEKYYAQRARAIEKRLKELADDFRTVLSHFGISANVLELGGLTTTADTITAKMTQQAQAYRAAAGQLQAAGTVNAVALGNAAAMGLVPVEIMAGALEDADDNAGAAALMAAFADKPEVAEDETFSLADMAEAETDEAA